MMVIGIPGYTGYTRANFISQVPVGPRAADSGAGHGPGAADGSDTREEQRGGVCCGTMQGWHH